MRIRGFGRNALPRMRRAFLTVDRRVFSSENEPSFYDVPSVCVDGNGDSVFGTLRVPLDTPKGSIGLLSKLISGTGVMFRLTPGTYNFDWHLAPRRQFIVNLDAAVKITVSNGDSMVFEKGDVFFVEDIAGQGHFSQAVNSEARHSLFIPVDDVALRGLGARALIPNKGIPAQATAQQADDATTPKVFVFDAYGTLLDPSSIAIEDLDPAQSAEIIGTWRQKQLQYLWLRGIARGQDNFADFQSVTRDSLQYALEYHSYECAEGVIDNLIEQYYHLKAFPECTEALKKAKESGCKTVVLSNGTKDMLSSALKANGLTEYLDDIITADDAKCHKVDPKMYQSCVDRLQIRESLISFVSSNAWDACAAARFGFGWTSWVNRFGEPLERLPGAEKVVQQKSLVDVVNI
eukprot:jgi/Bigna1/71403/fgenesh1_pg.15_\